jgi:ATP-dependent RNA helicase HelY
VSAGAFVLDPFQIQALAAVDAGLNVLVAAPTGAGKTVVAEHAVARALAEWGKAFYTTPIKALSNQKYADLVAAPRRRSRWAAHRRQRHQPEAPVVVMTTEVLRNMIYAASHDARRARWVVLDEVHFLQDAYRGPVWEEVIVHAPPSVRFVCLSATVSNAEELAQWITSVRGPTSVVIETERPVELENHYLVLDRAPGAGPGRDPRRRSAQPRGSRFDARSTAVPGPRPGAPAAGGGVHPAAPRGGRAPRRRAACCPPSTSSSAARAATTPPGRWSMPALASPRRGAPRIRRIVEDQHVGHLSDADLAVLGWDAGCRPSRPASRPTTPGWCRRSRRRSRRASWRAW